jgi:transposase
MDGPGAEGPQARFGLKATHRRLWCPFGSRPPWTHEHQYHWFWLYTAVEPASGACVVLFLPHIDGICFERFLEEFRQHTGADRIGLVLDNSGSHTSGKVRWSDGVEKIPLPPYSPELNPAERWFEPCAGSSPTRSSTSWKTSKPLSRRLFGPIGRTPPSSSAWSAFHGGVMP